MRPMIQSDGPVVIVDDSQEDRYLAETVYGRSNCKNPLILFESGQNLLDYLEEVKEGVKKTPSLVLIDINMPEMDGFELLRKIRAQKKFEKIPILVMLTSSQDPEDMKRAVMNGANGYQEKPFGVQSYVHFFNSLIA